MMIFIESLIMKQNFLILTFKKDYQKLQNVALVKKQQKTVENWVKKRRALTYVKIDDEFRKCKLKYDWFDEPLSKSEQNKQ